MIGATYVVEIQTLDGHQYSTLDYCGLVEIEGGKEVLAKLGHHVTS